MNFFTDNWIVENKDILPGILGKIAKKCEFRVIFDGSPGLDGDTTGVWCNATPKASSNHIYDMTVIVYKDCAIKGMDWIKNELDWTNFDQYVENITSLHDPCWEEKVKKWMIKVSLQER